MLKVIPINNPQAKREYFAKNFTDSFSTKTWVVSDLTSKLAFQKELFKTQKIIPDESLLRAQELWTKFIQRLRPDLRFVSYDIAIVQTSHFLKNAEEEWMRRPGVAQLVHSYLEQLMPILSHSENFEMMKEYFKKNIESFQKWGQWYLLANQVYHLFLEQKIILPTWSASILVNELGFEKVWNRELVLDLGAQLQPIESELLLRISKTIPVTVLIPNPEWKKEHQKTFKSYEPLIEDALPRNDKNNLLICKADYLKFSTQLAEVQQLCVELRKWISQEKISPSKIAISAPDIGSYWPVLYEYLKTEGIPYQRKQQTPLKTFPEIYQWMAKLKIEIGELNYTELETEVFSSQENLPRYEDFKSQFINIYGIEDLERNSEIFKKYKNTPPENILSIKEFLTWAQTFWIETWPIQRLTFLIEKTYSEVASNMKFGVAEWIVIIEKLAAKLEVTQDEGYSEGVHCIDLISLKDLDVEKVYLLGLTDQALRSMSKTLISDFDIELLKNQFGFTVAESEKAELEFEVLWNLENTNASFSLSYPQTDFDGNQLSPSIVWLSGAYKQHGEKIPLKIPDPSRWSSLQSSDPENFIQERFFEKNEFLKMQLRLAQDQGQKPSPWKLSDHLTKISASQIEDYLNCPFINASKKLFKLNDLPDLDIDVDAQTRGKILHAAAEILFKEYPDLNLTSLQLSNIFEKIKKDLKIQVINESFWNAQKNKFVKIIEKFIVFEKEWKSKFPDLKSSTQEINFEMYVNFDTGKIENIKNDKSIILRGRIDRVDLDKSENACVVIDYKFDSTRFHSHGAWFEHNELQLALYSMAIEAGCLGGYKDVLGAVYYGFKNLDREKGFLNLDADGYLFAANPRKGHKIDTGGKLEIYKKLEATMKETLSNMKAGDYNPNPKDMNTCKTCNWRSLCRAPHLN